jgi:uncharacterized membrane protein
MKRWRRSVVVRMRMALVVVGVVLLVIGAVLMFVPVSSQADQTIPAHSALPFVEFSVSGFSLTGSIPVAVSWTSTGPVTVVAVAGSTNVGNPSAATGATIQTGTSGSFTINQPDGGAVVLGALNLSGNGNSSPSTTFKITTALTSVGSILLIVGILLLIVGVVLKSKSKISPQPMAPPMDQSTGMGSSPPPP